MIWSWMTEWFTLVINKEFINLCCSLVLRDFILSSWQLYDSSKTYINGNTLVYVESYRTRERESVFHSIWAYTVHTFEIYTCSTQASKSFAASWKFNIVCVASAQNFHISQAYPVITVDRQTDKSYIRFTVFFLFCYVFVHSNPVRFVSHIKLYSWFSSAQS